MIKCVAIDDDKLFLKSLQVMFEELEEFELSATFANAIDGIMQCIALKPNVLLIDYEMPYLNGLDSLEVMEQRPKVIMISGHISAPDAKDYPIDGFISKRELSDPQLLSNEIARIMA